MAMSHQTVGGAAWSEKDFNHVLARWNLDGASAGVIAAELGRTRNSVCGLIHRYRDQFDDRSQGAPALRVTGPAAKAKPAPRPVAPQPPWTDAEIETAEKLWSEWALIREIAGALGKSYDAVNRFINLNREKFPNRYRTARAGVERMARPARALPFRAEEVAAPSLDHAVTFLAVTDRECRWPLWGKDENPGADGLCCGAPIEFGLVYCPYHKRKSKQGEHAAAESQVAA